MTKLCTERKARNTRKLISPQVLTSPLRSPFAMYTANQWLLDCEILVHHEGFHPIYFSPIN